MGLFPDSNALSCAVANLAAVQEISVVIETSYFLDTKRGARNPAGVEILRDGGVAPKHKVPQCARSETRFDCSLVLRKCELFSLAGGVDNGYFAS
jgi:hypothetical protein